MIANKVVIITGAAGGIGVAIAEHFYRKGFHLLLSDIHQEGLDNLKKELILKHSVLGDIVIHSGDLSHMDYIKSIVNKCGLHWGRVDVLINNAAWRQHETLRRITEKTWNKTLQICLTAPAFLGKWAAELMESKNIEGVIINLSSIMSNRASGTGPAYVACKGGIESLTYEMASLYGPSGIRVIGLAPGNIATAMSADYKDPAGENLSARLEQQMNDQTPLGRPGHALEIANAIFWLASTEASFITGTVIQIDGGFSHNFGPYSLKKKQFPEEF